MMMAPVSLGLGNRPERVVGGRADTVCATRPMSSSFRQQASWRTAGSDGRADAVGVVDTGKDVDLGISADVVDGKMHVRVRVRLCGPT